MAMLFLKISKRDKKDLKLNKDKCHSKKFKNLISDGGKVNGPAVLISITVIY